MRYCKFQTEWVVNVTGLRCCEVVRRAELELPLQQTQHQYLVTDNI